MSELRICGVFEVVDVIEQYKIQKIISCLSNYKIVDSAYGLTSSVISLNPNHWNDQSNWLKLNMEDVVNPDTNDAPTMNEVVKGITYGATAIKSGTNLLVHCQLGVSRSPAMAIGSLLSSGSSIVDAYQRVVSVRPRIDPNPLIIKLIDEHLKLNGELIKHNDEFRTGIRKDLKKEYSKLMESYLHDSKTLDVIFEHMSALNRL